MNESTGQTLFIEVIRARSPRERAKGLLGTSSLPEGRALLIERARQVHTFGMKYPIDIIFCNRDMRVIDVLSAVVPMRLTPLRWRSRYVFEAAVGTTRGVTTGDVLSLQPIER